MGNKKFIFILLFIFIFTIGCSKNDNSEEEKSVDYINEHLNASRYTNFTLQKTIKKLEFADIKIAGMILNSFDEKASNYRYYKYNYKYKYKYEYTSKRD